MTTLRINVTARDIREGTAMLCDCCPVARAVRRHVPGVEITPSSVERRNARGKLECLDLPPRVVEFIEDFDSGENVEPFRFTLTVPDSWRVGR